MNIAATETQHPEELCMMFRSKQGTGKSDANLWEIWKHKAYITNKETKV